MLLFVVCTKSEITPRSFLRSSLCLETGCLSSCFSSWCPSLETWSTYSRRSVVWKPNFGEDEFQRFVQVTTCKIKVRQGFVRQPAYIDLLASPDIAGSLTVWLDFHPPDACRGAVEVCNWCVDFVPTHAMSLGCEAAWPCVNAGCVYVGKGKVLPVHAVRHMGHRRYYSTCSELRPYVEGSCQCHPLERVPVTHWIWGWESPCFGVNVMGKRKMCCHAESRSILL